MRRLFFAAVVLRKSRVLSVAPGKSRVPHRAVFQILKTGVPAAIVNLMQSASVVLMNQFLLPYGNQKIAAMGIVLKISRIALLLLTGFAFGGQPLFGYYYGAGDKARLSALFRFCVRFIGLAAFLLTAGIYAAAPLLMRCFMDSEGIVADGTVMLRWQVITMFFVGLILLMTILFQAMGKATGAFILSISRQDVLSLLVLIAAYHLAGYEGVVASQAISDCLTAVIAFGLFQTRLRKEFGAFGA